MTDTELATCEYCGDEYKQQGLATHQRYCDEAPAEDPFEDAESAVEAVDVADEDSGIVEEDSAVGADGPSLPNPD